MSRAYWSLLTLILWSSCVKKAPISFPDYFPQDKKIFFDTVNQASIELGEKLFFDKRLSYNDSISCASCHDPNLAFTDGKKISTGIYGRHTIHNSSTLLNVGFSSTFMFDMRSHNLDAQTMIPIQDSNEMQETIFHVEKKLSTDAEYEAMAKKAYGTKLTIYAYTSALAAYMKSLISSKTRYDKLQNTKDTSRLLSTNEINGMKLFFGKGKCNQCHTAPLFTNFEHYNLGLEKGENGKIGLMRMTLKPVDKGRYKTPTLRNIAVTYPYFHDGRIVDLKGAILFHLSSDRNTMDYLAPILSDKELDNLISFLETLTDENLEKSAYLQSK